MPPVDETVSDYSFKQTTLAHIPVSKVRENAEALRTVVDKTSSEYLEGLESVKKHGILNPVLVREIVDPTTKEKLFGMIDGLHRLNWAMDAGLTEIPAQIGSLDDADLLEAQILANVHKIETKPVQYTKALLKIMGANPAMTKGELCARLSKSPAWLNDRLHLMKLDPSIQTMVDNNSIGLANAYALARLPVDKQKELAEAAASQSPAEFVPTANNLLKEIQASRREGRALVEDKFMPVPRVQRPATLKDELGFLTTGQMAASKVAYLVDTYAEGNPMKAAVLAIQFCLHIDPETLKIDEANWVKQKQTDAEKKKLREEERKKKKDAAAAVAAAAAGVHA